MCQFYYDPGTGNVNEGLALVPNTLVIPHHNTFGKSWSAQLLIRQPSLTLLGIDERTGMLRKGSTEDWQVLGQGSVTVYRKGKREEYQAGESFSL